MKNPLRPLLTLPAALGAMLLASCVGTSTVESRVAARPETYRNQPAAHRTLIDQGKVAEGMSKDGVYLAWGSPDGMRESSSCGRRTESWVYRDYQPVYSQHVDIGYGYGGYGYGRRGRYYGAGAYDCYPYGGYSHGFTTHVDYVPYIARTVDFRNNKVIAWESRR